MGAFQEGFCQAGSELRDLTQIFGEQGPHSSYPVLSYDLPIFQALPAQVAQRTIAHSSRAHVNQHLWKVGDLQAFTGMKSFGSELTL